MTIQELFQLLLSLKGNPKVYVEEGTYQGDTLTIPMIRFYFHRQHRRHFEKARWERTVFPAGVLLEFVQVGHERLRELTQGSQVSVIPKHTGMPAPKKLEEILKRAIRSG